MSLSPREQQALDSIADGLAGSDPKLASLLVTFTRLTAAEEIPVREKIRAGWRQATRRQRRSRRHPLFQGHRLSPAHRRIARFLLEHPGEAVYLIAAELGQRAQVSQPSVTRFAAALGFGGYPELRAELRLRVLGEAAACGPDDADSLLHRAIAADILNLRQLTSSPWAGERLDRVGANLAASRPLRVFLPRSCRLSCPGRSWCPSGWRLPRAPAGRVLPG